MCFALTGQEEEAKGGEAASASMIALQAFSSVEMPCKGIPSNEKIWHLRECAVSVSVCQVRLTLSAVHMSSGVIYHPHVQI